MHDIRPYLVTYPLLCGTVLAPALPHAGSMAPAVLLYSMTVLSMMSLASSGLLWLRVRHTLFVLSDSILAMQPFIPGFEFPQFDFAITSAYAGGHALMTWGAILTQRPLRQLVAQPA
ncbi:lysoplasmalogenase family protein [Paeniglutamicibacter cryotolerans]|uniref:lysoplasmalogenase family protein n=1 Tax=Paeniglutamicibacter cryotolerans TaxID=670079 RepID=UPI00160BF9F6|nr:lysoplasmalogenase family protein [Paeniglutamicibacter cryotolerans]